MKYETLKYGFCKKSNRKNETVLIWKKKRAKSVQRDRVSFFRSDFLQNPHFKSRTAMGSSFINMEGFVMIHLNLPFEKKVNKHLKESGKKKMSIRFTVEQDF